MAAEQAVRVEREEGLGAGATAVVVTGIVVALLLLVLPGLLLLWYSPAFRSGATCTVGFQAFCSPGYGMPQLYAVLTGALLAGAAVVASAVLAIAGHRRPALVAVGLALALAALTLVLAMAGPGHGLPADWFIA